MQFDRSEAQLTMLREKLSKTEKALGEVASEKNALQKGNAKLKSDYAEISQQNENLSRQIRVMQFDLEHERKRRTLSSTNDPFDRLKYSIQENENDGVENEDLNTENPTHGSLSRNPSFDESSSSVEVPAQIQDILKRFNEGADDDDDEVFRLPSPPPSTQNENLESDNRYVFRRPHPTPASDRKRKAPTEDHVVAQLEEHQSDENLAGPSTCNFKRKPFERRSMVSFTTQLGFLYQYFRFQRFQGQKERVTNRSWETGPKKRREDFPPEITSSVPETPEGSPQN